MKINPRLVLSLFSILLALSFLPSNAIALSPSITTITCAPNPIDRDIATTCTVTVIDTSTTATAPTGTVTLTTDKTGSFTPSTPCSLTPGTTSSDCFIDYTPKAIIPGTHKIMAHYSGDSSHDPSNGQFLLTVSIPSFPVVDPFYAGKYSVTDLGPVPGVPTRYGGLTLSIDNPNILIIGGDANAVGGALYSVGVIRDANNHIVGFSGTATKFADAAYNDGGVTYGPGKVLFLARWPQNEMGQTKPGSTITDKIIDLTPLQIASSPGGLTFVPSGYPGEGHLKIVSWSGGQFYDSIVTPDGTGTYNLASITNIPGSQMPGGPEGFIYVPRGSDLFPTPSILVSEYSANTVSALEVDISGDPVISTRKSFITGLTGAEGAFTDPLTGDFMFSTFGGNNRVVVVNGFARPFDYKLEITPTSNTVTLGTTPVTTTATVTALLTAGVPPGIALTATVTGPSSLVTAGLNPTPVTPTAAGTPSTLTVIAPPTTAVGDYTITVKGSPNGVTPIDETVTFTLTVQAAPLVHPTATMVSCTASSLPIYTTVTCTSTVTDTSPNPTTPTGQITFTPGGICTLTGTGASASCQVIITPTELGSLVVNANYPGDASHATSSGMFTITVGKRHTIASVVCSPASVNINQASTCTSTITDNSPGSTSTPTGTITWTHTNTGSFSTTACTLAGTGPSVSCSVTYTPTTTGSHVITGSYPGDMAHDNSSASFTIKVAVHATTTTISCAPTTLLVGQATSCTVTVRDTEEITTTPTGTVTVTLGGTCTLAGTGATATCTVNITPTATGSLTISANYPGDTTHAKSNGSITVTVNLHTTTTTVACTPTLMVIGQPTSCTATVTDTAAGTASTPAGTVTFTPGGTCTLAGTGASSSCSVNVTPIATGTLTVSASYPADATHAASSGSANVTVTARPTTTTVACTPTTVIIGQATSCTATVADTGVGTASTPSGGVTFTPGGTCTLSGTGASAACSVSITTTSAGPLIVSASYTGDERHITSTGSATLNVTSPVSHVDLTFQAFDCDDFENGMGQLDVLVNGVVIVNIPAGLHHLTGSGDYLPYMEKRVTIGPIDIGTHVTIGTNTIVFRNPLDNHGCEVSHILIQSNGKTLLNSTKTREVEPDEPATLTFSNPPLEITSLNVTPTTVNKGDKVTVTASYTGGTGPFQCKFSFGDGSHAIVESNGPSCRTTHTYRKAGTFQITVKITGANTGDRASQSIKVTVQKSPAHDRDHDNDIDDHHEDDHNDRICSNREKGHSRSDNDNHTDNERHA